MNREIKFRAWDKENKIMGSVILLDWTFFTRVGLNGGDILQFSDVELMQYTGLKDKNYTDIYEGDIVKANDYIGVVKYGEFDIEKMLSEQSEEIAELLICTSSYGLYIAFQDGTEYLLDNNTEEWLEVIGNIYENPELLKVCSSNT